MGDLRIRFLTVCLLVLPKSVVGVDCGDILFPSLKEHTLNIPEHSVVKIPFEFPEKACAKENDVIITIAHKTPESKISSPFCRILHLNGACLVPLGEYGCSCSQHDGKFLFIKTITREDAASWIWRSKANKRETEIMFNVTYPAVILNLTLSSLSQEPVSQNTPVEIICSWKNGNPPVTARLLDRHRVEMEGSIYSSGQIRYRFPAVGCQDAGLIHCEAPGASQNKTTTLVAKCAPAFVNTTNVEVNVTLNQNVKLDFNVRAHSTEFGACRLFKDVSKQPERGKFPHPNVSFAYHGSVIVDCTDYVRLTGSPPDLTLTVRLDNVRKEEEGQWRLELTNDVGTGKLGLCIHVDTGVMAADTKHTMDSTLAGLTTNVYLSEQNSSGSSTGTGIIAIVGGVAAVALVAATIAIFLFIVLVRRGMKAGLNSMPVQENIIMEVPCQRQESLSDESFEDEANYYWEISDEAASQSQDEEPPRPCHRAETLPDDYLHPTASPPATEGTD